MRLGQAPLRHGDFSSLGVKHRIKSPYAAGPLPGPQFQATGLPFRA